MEKINLSLKGIRVDEMTFKLNAVRQQPKMELKPTFSRRVRRAVENEKMIFVSLTVKIEKTAESTKPFDLEVTYTGLFESDATDEASRRAAVIEGTKIIYPYLRAGVTTLTTAALAAPIVLPVVGGSIFPEDNEPESDGLYS